MKLSNQAMGALMMALQKSLMEQSDITGMLKDFDLQETEGFKGYDIDLELASYNAKSLKKTQQKETIFKIII